MRTDAAEFVVKAVQVFAQQPHDLHAEIAVLPQKLQELLARNENRPRLLARFSGNPIPFPSHALAQPEHSSRPDNLQKLLLSLAGGQQDANRAALHQVDASDSGTLLKQRCAFGEQLNRLDPAKSLQQIGTYPARHGLRRHNSTSCLSLSYTHLETARCDLMAALNDRGLETAGNRLHLLRPGGGEFLNSFRFISYEAALDWGFSGG